MSSELVRKALELDDQLSKSSSSSKGNAGQRTGKRKSHQKQKKSTSLVKPRDKKDLIERNVQIFLKNQKKVKPNQRLLNKMADGQVPKWQLKPKKKKVKKEDKIPESAYDISDVLLR